MPNDKSVTGRGEGAPAKSQLDSFLEEVKELASGGGGGGRGRIVFALDATMSRDETWDHAAKLQADMFREVGSTGLEVQLVYFRGTGDCAECRASRWTTDTRYLTKLMTGISCRTGHTQLRKVLAHARKETELLKVGALIFVGDALEESPDEVIPEAHELGRLSVPAFMFQEGDDRDVEKTFREIARVTHGAYCRFDPGAARQLGELLKAVAAFVTGGLAALETRKDAGAIKLLGQLR
jgi:hypothetical protein